MLKKYRHVSFDLDGTLVSTIADYRRRIVPKTVLDCGLFSKKIHSLSELFA